jgi:hypothetical protein
MFDVENGTYYSTLWFIHGGADEDGIGRDWLCMLYQEPGKKWQIKGRFRYYTSGDDPFGEDHKSWFEARARPGATEAREIDNVGKIAQALHAAGFGPKLEIVPIGTSDAEVFRKILEVQPWVYMKAVNSDAVEGEEDGFMRMRGDAP